MKTSYAKYLSKNRRKSYKTYLLEKGLNAEGISQNAKSHAEAEERLSTPERGAIGEGLWRGGLLFSGYSDYLKSEGQKRKKERAEAAEGNYYRRVRENLDGYSDYISNYEALIEKEKESLVNRIKELGILDSNAAMDLAKDTSLNESEARGIAEYGTRLVRQAAVKRAVSYVKSKGYTYKGALEYAKGLGLNEKDAISVAEAAGRASFSDYDYYSSLEPDSYFDFILNQTNKQ